MSLAFSFARNSRRRLASARAIFCTDFGVRWGAAKPDLPGCRRVFEWCLRRATGLGLAVTPFVPLFALWIYRTGHWGYLLGVRAVLPSAIADGWGAWAASAVALLYASHRRVLVREWLWIVAMGINLALLLQACFTIPAVVK